MRNGQGGRCQIDESKVLVECRQDHGTRCPSKRVPSATLTLFHPPWSSPSSTNHPRHRSHTQYTSLCCFHITAPTTASISSSARRVSHITSASSSWHSAWHSLPRRRVSPATCNRAVWRLVGANRTAVPACATLKDAGGVRKYVSSRRVRVVYLDPLCGAFAVLLSQAKHRHRRTDKCGLPANSLSTACQHSWSSLG